MLLIARIKCGKTQGYVEAKDDEVWQYICSNYRDWMNDKNITLLYLSKRFILGENSLIADVTDADYFLAFLKKHLFPLECVNSVHIFNLMKPTFFPVPQGMCLDLKRFTVTINARPANYKDIYDAICKIKPTNNFVVHYVAYIFSDHGSDIVTSVLANGLSSAKKGVQEHIDILDGVYETDIVWITKTKELLSTMETKKLKEPTYTKDEFAASA
ncbi:MAG: hypothetical protein JSW00_17855 [Thermoplasmata archaeon]|nr:MAG: hypothetical protein JSW00_17855 [Thermoplasmata archaeon]